MVLKRSLEKGEYFGKAEMLYLQALHLAIEDKNLASVAHVQDLLANLALANNQLEKVSVLLELFFKQLCSIVDCAVICTFFVLMMFLNLFLV